MKRLICTTIALTSLWITGCSKETLSVDTPDAGDGQVTAIEAIFVDAAAVYTEADTDPAALRYGSLKLQELQIDNVPYVQDWGQEQEFKSLKIGDKIAFTSTGQMVRVKAGPRAGNYRVIKVRPQ